MNRAMFSGVAGLKTHQTRMDVIGNNISNVNTVGYKSQSALFADLLYQNSSNATGPNPETNIGGTNAKQVGLGAKVASISTNITLPGSTETTNNPFDLRITGDSFFIVNDGSENLFTRDGSFKVDAAGNLVMSANGYKVQGWLPEYDGSNVIKKDTVTALQVMSAANLTYPAAATTEAHVSGIVDAESPEVNSKDGKLMNLNFYDSRGYSYTAKLAIKRVGDSNDKVNSYSCELVKLLDAEGKDVTDKMGAKGAGTIADLVEDETKKISDTITKNTDSYEIRRVNATDNSYTVYTIKANTDVTAEYFDSGNNKLTWPTDRDAFSEVAAIFGYDAKDFPYMMSGSTSVGKNGSGLYSILVGQGIDTTSIQQKVTLGGTEKTPTPTITKGTDSYTIATGTPAVTYTINKNGVTASDATITDPVASLATVFGYTSAGDFKNAEYNNTKVGDDGGKGLYNILKAQKIGEAIQQEVVFDKKSINGCVIDFSKQSGAFVGLNNQTGVKTAVLEFGALGDALSLEDIAIDFSSLSNVGNGGVSTAEATSGSLENEGEGRMIGRMKGVTIGSEGKIYATYDNGQRKLIGQVAVAQFANPSGLEKAGENLYKTTQNSGDFDGIGRDVTADGGKMSPGELESSNVDLSGELTSMIVTQRGFQANSRIITVSDTMLEELINLKR